MLLCSDPAFFAQSVTWDFLNIATAPVSSVTPCCIQYSTQLTPCTILMWMQTVQHYKEALAMGQKAFETPGPAAKPLPYIFGSAAYIQDQYAGLASLETQQSAPQPDHEPYLNSHASKGQHSAALPPARHNRSVSPAQDTFQSNDFGQQPQNFKAMLEAALKGNVVSNLATSELATSSQYQASLDREATATSHHQGASQLGLQDSHQPEKDNDVSADLPHVLAWLEKGRGLFDDDEEDEQNLNLPDS